MSDKRNIIIVILLFLLFRKSNCLCKPEEKDMPVMGDDILKNVPNTEKKSLEPLDIEFIERSTDTNLTDR